MNPKLFNPDYLLSLCQKYGLRPSKKYGQNFLLAPEAIEDMVAAAEVNKKDTVVEVGPGFGVLTFALAEKAEKVLAFEIEKKLQKYWSSYCHPERNEMEPRDPLKLVKGIPPLVSLGRNDSKECGNDSVGNIEIIWGNVLKNFASQKLGKYKVVANLPYQITSNVIRTFLESKNPPSVMVLMVQKEVAERICAQPGEMSLLAVAVQYYADAEIVAQVPRHLFWPEPAVDSSVIKMTARRRCHPERGETESRDPSTRSLRSLGRDDSKELGRDDSKELGRDDSKELGRDDSKKCVQDDNCVRTGAFEKEFFRLVKAGFAQKRKKLVKNLPQAKPFFKELGISEQARAQELSLEQWKKLVIHLSV